jgi:hypothetical protein
VVSIIMEDRAAREVAMRTRLNRDVSDRVDDCAPAAHSSVAMPTGTPPWMWLARESLPHLPRILQAVARIVLALLLGGAALVLALKGRSVSGELLRMVR